MARIRRFHFKRLDVYHEAFDYFVWTVGIVSGLPYRYTKVSDQAIGAAPSMLGNLGEAGGRRLKPGEASQHYRYAQGSNHESAAYLDVLATIVRLDDETYNHREEQLARIGSMLTRLIDLQERRKSGRS